MAIIKPKINSLDFDGIKASIINYVSSKDEFKDYDFTGSAINNFIDILAYNTLYYAFYSNMVATEGFLDTAKLESSIISLCKPLGVVVPGKSCSRVIYEVKNETSNNTEISAYETAFTGIKNGVNYSFYSIQDEIIIPGSTKTIVLYESKTAVLDLEINVDLATQVAFLGTTDIDIETVRIKVINAEYPQGKIWTRKTAIDSNIAEDDDVYFIERTASGFALIFGKKTVNDFAEITTGKDITEQDTVYVSYLISSGSNANSITQINVTPLTLLNSEPSYGGTDGPNLDTIKSLAPKFFAANDRAVTRDDYYGILFNNGKITNLAEINIWGGEEAEPISYGRVFISFINGLSEEDPRVKDIITLLKNKSVITVIPEYVIPVPLTFNTGLNVRLNRSFNVNQANLAADIRSTLNTNYPSSFNFNFKLEEVNSLLKQRSSAITLVTLNSNDTNIQARIAYSNSDRIIYFKNEFYPSVGIGTAINSEPIPTSLSSFDIILSDFPLEFIDSEPTTGKLVGRYNDGNLEQTGYDIDDLGYIDYRSGIVIIYSSFLSRIRNTSQTYSLYAIPRYPTEVISKNEVIMNLNVAGIQFV